jgi:hypothetical protein
LSVRFITLTFLFVVCLAHCEFCISITPLDAALVDCCKGEVLGLQNAFCPVLRENLAEVAKNHAGGRRTTITGGGAYLRLEYERMRADVDAEGLSAFCPLEILFDSTRWNRFDSRFEMELRPPWRF